MYSYQHPRKDFFLKAYSMEGEVVLSGYKHLIPQIHTKYTHDILLHKLSVRLTAFCVL